MAKINIPYKQHLINKTPDLLSGEYVILDEEVSGYSAKINVLHTKCGRVFNPSVKNFTCKSKNGGKGTRCPRCQHQSYAFTIEEVKSYVERVTLGEYEVLSDRYDNNKYKLQFRHNHVLCKNHIFDMSWNDFKNGEQRCPECFRLLKSSKFHKYIRNFFIKFNIEYEEEKKFDTCKNIKHLPFDFFIPDLNLLIEYDGKQHERAWYDDEGKLQKTKNNDSIKNKWVENNTDYSLLRITGSISILADIMYDFFIDKDPTTISKYASNILYISNKEITELLK